MDIYGDLRKVASAVASEFVVVVALVGPGE